MNTSIKNAFERFWQITVAKINSAVSAKQDKISDTIILIDTENGNLYKIQIQNGQLVSIPIEEGSNV